MQVIGCTIKNDYRPCEGCPFERILDKCNYWTKYYHAKLKLE